MMNLFDYIKEYADSNPSSLAVVAEERTITYKELYNYIKSNNATLKKYGFTPMQKVIVKINKQVDFIIALLSLLSVECWVIPVPDDIKQDELEKVINLTGATKFPYENWEFYKCLEFTDDVNISDSNSTGILHLTSGSTGTPKLCIRTLHGLTCEGLSFKNTFTITTQERVLSASPLYHSYALGAAIMGAFVSGSCIYTIDSFVPRRVLKIIQNNSISFFILVPAMASLICDTISDQKYDLSSLRIALVGAGPIKEKVYNKFKEKYGVALLSNYGSTETGALVSRLDPLTYTSIGMPMDGVEIKLCDENGEKVGTGETGEIMVKCDGMLKAYFGIPETPFDKDGFFAMGDIAVQDSDGYLYIKGRKKLLINVGGKKVNPYEVEEVLMELAGVRECMVTGYINQNEEERVRAYIVGDGITESQIRSFCSEKLSQHKIPNEIIFTDCIPKNKLGKVIHQELKR